MNIGTRWRWLLVVALLSLPAMPAWADDSAPVAPDCPGASFNLPIEDVGPPGNLRPSIKVALGDWGLRQVMLDTGTSYNTVLIDSGTQSQPDLVLPYRGEIYSSTFRRKLAFHNWPVPGFLIARQRTIWHLDSFIINPWQVDPTGFTVMDIRHHRLLGFRYERDLRRCYGSGVTSDFGFQTGNYVNSFDIAAVIDGSVSGIVTLDTGAWLTEIYSRQVRHDGARQDETLAYYMGSGQRYVPYVAAGHSIKIGGVSRNLGKVGLPIDANTFHLNGIIGSLGYGDLQGAIIIAAPRQRKFWELIF